MLLVVDVGNTQTHFGMFRGDELVEHWRFATVRQSTADELGAALRNLLALRGLAFARAPDRWSVIGATDFLARSFTWHAPGLAAARGLGLAALQAAGVEVRRV